jgi:hypothetical protein
LRGSFGARRKAPEPVGLWSIQFYDKFYSPERALGRSETYRKKALQCLLAAERLRGPAERFAVLRIAQSWLTLANRAACGTATAPVASTDFELAVSDKGSANGGKVAAFEGNDQSPPAIPL